MSIKFEDYDDYGSVQHEPNLPPTSHPEANVFAPNQANDVPSPSVFRIQEGPDIKFHSGNGCIFPPQECDYDVSQLLDVHAASFNEQADALLQTGNLSLMTLGEIVASHDCNTEYQPLTTSNISPFREKTVVNIKSADMKYAWAPAYLWRS
ncbi:hypothetical protein Y032_0401g799 [Ancylostoma ceylanicum]|uniref:Uncharacterized protein n=2 Tax=Ancylostoma ceylanicum TaxID=53326 RepID=A0A016X2N7_9BILA|nr:hypothetical protein Y032_0401g799 [Ancylostoma ceylanicum]